MIKYRRKIGLLLALIMLSMMFSNFQLIVYAADGTGQVGDVTWTFTEATKTLTFSGPGRMSDFTSDYNSRPWVAVGGDKATTIIIEEGITHVGAYSFRGMPSFTTVHIPSTVKSIGEYAFYNDSSTVVKLETVTGMEGVENIGSYAFRYSDSLTSIPLNNVKTIGDFAFNNCPVLSDLGNLNKLVSTGKNSFSYCKALTSITLPEGFTTLGDYTFQNCDGLTNVSLPSTLTSIGQYAFDKCSSLTNITLPNNLQSIGASAFQNTSLTSIMIPESVNAIGSNAFRRIYNLKSITNYAKEQTVGSNILYESGSNVPVEERVVNYFSENISFETSIKQNTANPYQILYLDGKELNPLESTLEDWVQAGNSAESWIDAGNTIEDYINNGGTANSWGELLGSNATYLWQRADGTSNSWTKYGGNAISWGSYGGSPTSWAEAGGTLGSWEEAGGNVEEYQEEVPEEEGEDDEDYKDMILVYVDETLVNFPDVKPSVSNERILVPVRFVMQELGFEVNWDDLNKKAVMRLVESDGNKLEIEMRPNQSTMLVNGKSYLLETPLQIVAPGRLMLPGGELVKAMQDIYYKEEKLNIATYEGYYSSEDMVGAEPKLTDIPVIEEFIDNPNLIELTTENEENILENEVSMTDILVESEITNFDVRLPLKLEVFMNSFGERTITEGLEIQNDCVLGQVVVVDIELDTTRSDWTLVDISEDFTNKPINTKEYGLSLNGSTAVNNKIPLNQSLASPIRNGESKALSFDVKLPGQSKGVSQVITSLIVTVDFYK